MLKHIMSLLNRKTKLERYIYLLEKSNNYFNKHEKGIRKEWAGEIKKIMTPLSTQSPLSYDNGTDFLMVGKGSRKDN